MFYDDGRVAGEFLQKKFISDKCMVFTDVFRFYMMSIMLNDNDMAGKFSCHLSRREETRFKRLSSDHVDAWKLNGPCRGARFSKLRRFYAQFTLDEVVEIIHQKGIEARTEAK